MLRPQDPEALKRLVEAEGADVLCLQETKLQGSHVADTTAALGLQVGSRFFLCV